MRVRASSARRRGETEAGRRLARECGSRLPVTGYTAICVDTAAVGSRLSYQGRMLGHASTPPIRPQLAFSAARERARAAKKNARSGMDKLQELSIPIVEVPIISRRAISSGGRVSGINIPVYIRPSFARSAG